MTNYVGEVMRVAVSALDFDADVVTDEDVDAVTVTMFNAAGEEIISEVAMDWSISERLWYFLWVTTEDQTAVDDGGIALASGTYRAKCKLIDSDGHPSWEFVKIRLARNPVGD